MLTDYLVCALWSSTDCDDDPLDLHYDVRDFSKEAVNQAKNDIENFMIQAEQYINDDVNTSQVGHDFWLTRNGHGAGFWDRPEVYGENNAEKLTNIANSFGEKYIYVKNGVLYFEN